MIQELTPRQIVQELDKYIIGQDNAKKSVAIALRNRWRRQYADKEMRDEIMPNNIIMIGPTGVGKTEIARRLAKLSGAPFIKVEATKFTEVGYVGRDVDSMIRDLIDLAINIVKDEQVQKMEGRAKELAEERILDILFAPAEENKPVAPPKNMIQGPGFVMTNSDKEKAIELVPEPEVDPEEEARKNRTREKFRKMLRNGDLDDREIELNVSSDKSPMLQVFGPMGMEEMGVNIQDMLGGMGGGGRKMKKRRMKVEEAREVLTKEEAEKLLDMDKVTQEALKRTENSGIVFIDEIDKVASKSNKGGGAEVSREGVQRDLLPIVEGSTVASKHGVVKTDHILFIASGAFHVSKPSDLIPELQGRFPIRVELNSLNEEDFYKILTIPKNALIKQYKALFASEGVSIEFTDEAVREVASIAAHVNEEVENIGARRLHTILTTLLEELLFDIPDVIESNNVVIDKKLVDDRLSSVVKDKDLSHYIL